MTTIRLSPHRTVGPGHPVYFVADIGANHDGDLSRARMLIERAAQAGADAVKFQHFRAETLASREGFAAIGRPELYEVYEKAETPLEWIPTLAEDCRRAGVDFLSTPYDREAADALEPYVHAYKVGSGDLNEIGFIGWLAGKGKPVMLSTGGADWVIVYLAASEVYKRAPLVLMQCNLNYDGGLPASLRHVNLNVLRGYAAAFPEAVLGFSDHTPSRLAVLGAVALGAKVIEKHLTDDANREGPDHAFALEPKDCWAKMVTDVRQLELALGDGVKRVEENEKAWRVIARRGNWGGKRLRPCPE
jgi:sialic acid synthase SpsE